MFNRRPEHGSLVPTDDFDNFGKRIVPVLFFQIWGPKIISPAFCFANPELASRPHQSSGPVVCMVWVGTNVVLEGRKMLGATKPSESSMGTIRGDFCLEWVPSLDLMSLYPISHYESGLPHVSCTWTIISKTFSPSTISCPKSTTADFHENKVVVHKIILLSPLWFHPSLMLCLGVCPGWDATCATGPTP